VPEVGERFVIQRKQKDGSFVDWRDPMGGPGDYGSQGEASTVILRRTYSCTRLDFRIIRRVWSFVDYEP
jgi:hypothetical protein